ncbi:hypothetical protein ACJDU8_17180 [Clostridium sp. WILCCON 0269]|uniref:Uncharacterized protein n=1 Tax=Candidatus Clostridium eludens TaxID=3381663 RepID=A0ABW8SMK2_9CLOT
MKWDENRKQKIRNQLVKKVTPFMKEVKVLRSEGNVFGEKGNDQYVCTTNGYYHVGSTSVNIVNYSTEAANLDKNYQDRLLLIVDDEVKKIKEHDYFQLDDVKYEIINKGNVEDVVWDTYLKRKE